MKNIISNVFIGLSLLCSADTSFALNPAKTTAKEWKMSKPAKIGVGGGVFQNQELSEITLYDVEGVRAKGDLTDIGYAFNEVKEYPIRIIYEEIEYYLPLEKDIACQAWDFILTDDELLFSIMPNVEDEASQQEREKVLADMNMVEIDHPVYIHSALNFRDTAQMLYEYDILTSTEEINLTNAGSSREEFLTAVKRSGGLVDNRTFMEIFLNSIENEELNILGKSYANMDANSTYTLHINASDKGNAKEVDISGLPLRYYYYLNGNLEAVIFDIEIFSFPKREEEINYKAILFYQSLAVLRTLKKNNGSEILDNFQNFCS